MKTFLWKIQKTLSEKSSAAGDVEGIKLWVGGLLRWGENLKSFMGWFGDEILKISQLFYWVGKIYSVASKVRSKL